MIVSLLEIKKTAECGLPSTAIEQIAGFDFRSGAAGIFDLDLHLIGVEIHDFHFRFFTNLGAVGSRLLWMGAAGTQSNTLVLTSEYQNMKALGKGADAFLAGADGQKILEDAFGAKAPTTVLSQEVYQEIQL